MILITSKLIPFEEGSESFTLGLHLIHLYFIRISLSTPKTFGFISVYVRVVGGGRLVAESEMRVHMWFRNRTYET